MPVPPPNLEAPAAGAPMGDAKATDDAGTEIARRRGIYARRMYVAGEQYDVENAAAWAAYKEAKPTALRLPEHERIHAYSTQLGECTAFIADQLLEGFTYTVGDPTTPATDDKATLDVIDRTMRASPQFTGAAEADQPTLWPILYDALQAGDVAVRLHWDDVERTVWWEAWESEAVQVFASRADRYDRVVRNSDVWVPQLTGGTSKLIERAVYEVRTLTDETGAQVRECVEEIWHGDRIVATNLLGVPFIPWVLLRVGQEGLRSVRGASVVTEQAMAAADRYNANEQHSYLISRYNSHGNVVISGTTAKLMAENAERIEKDVADVLIVDGDTTVTAITLPTDPQMIEHQRLVLGRSIYATFGLVQVDPETVDGFSGASGYALEILNRRTDGTFRRIQRLFRRDLLTLFTLTLDMTEQRTGATVTVDAEVVADRRLPRDIRITMGTGYVVDDVRLREDHVAGLISRQTALRERGKTKEFIAQNEDEIAEEAAAAAAAGGETGMFGTAAPSPNGTTAGALTGTTVRA